MDGIAIERTLMEPFRRWAETVIDTSKLSAHDLQQAIREQFNNEASPHSVITITSFGYSRGIPHNADLVFDLRFLRNPHWDPALRGRNGQDPAVAAYVAADPLHDEFMARVTDMTRFLLPAFRAEGKSHLAIGFGCTGGQHRSVAVAERQAKTLAEEGWHVSKRHRELERHAEAATPPNQGRDA